MNLSDPSGDDSSSGETPTPAKRLRSDTYGASSTTSNGSDSDDEPETNSDYQKPNKSKQSYSNHSPERNARLSSRSSLSENCSSPQDQFDDFRPTFDDKDTENGESSTRASFQTANDSFYSKNDNEPDYSYSNEYSNISKRLMSKMGFKPGKGLGKFEHGRVEPVEASSQKGRRGLGMKPSVVGSIPHDFKWTPDEDKPEAKEILSWMSPSPDETLSSDVLEEWLRKGPKKLTIADETDFVQEHILKGVLEAKTIFDTLDDEDLRNARFRSNPYETIGSVIFLNRAAVKMANIDAICDFMFTSPKKPDGEDAVDKKEILYFADVCAGPGGFSEYVLYRKGWKAKGFGFTLKGKNDFKLSDFYAGTPETFNPYYGIKDDGNIFDPANLMSLKEHVLKQTDDKGVHFLMADGGFSVEGQENIQEILSKQLYLCQCLAALMLVRTGGNFVVKLFDVFTHFSIGLIYILYRCFEKVCIHKPVTSRPANSERYLICFWKKLGTEAVENHLYSVNCMLWNNTNTDEDVAELVPLTVMQEDNSFYEYMFRSNCVIGEKQIKNLLKIAAFSKDKNLKETSQAEMKEQCLQIWKIPVQVRTQPKRQNPDDVLGMILSSMEGPKLDNSTPYSFKSNVLSKPPEYLETERDLNRFKNVYDWHFMFLSSGRNCPDLRIFMGCGGKKVFQLESSGWKSAVDLHLTLPTKTLIYGEIVKEYIGQGHNQMHSKSLHIIDALMLGGVDVSRLPLTERINQCYLFCTALNKPFDSQALPIRSKRMFNMEKFSTAVENLQHRSMKRVKQAVTIETPDRVNRSEMFYVVGSLLFIKEIKEPWSAQMSKKSGCKYYFCMGKDKKPCSEYFIPEVAALDMVNAYSSRVMWSWESAATAILEGEKHSGVTRLQLEGHIQRNINR